VVELGLFLDVETVMFAFQECFGSSDSWHLKNATSAEGKMPCLLPNVACASSIELLCCLEDITIEGNKHSAWHLIAAKIEKQQRWKHNDMLPQNNWSEFWKFKTNVFTHFVKCM